MQYFLDKGIIGEAIVVKIIERLNTAYGLNVFETSPNIPFTSILKKLEEIDDAFLQKILAEIASETTQIKQFKMDMVLSKQDQSIMMKDYIKSEYTIVDIWASWCRPCIKSFPKNDLLIEQSEIPPPTICLAYDDKDKVQKAIKKLDNYNNLDFFYCKKKDLSRGNIRITAFPSYFIIDQSGVVVSEIFHDFKACYQYYKELANRGS